MDTLVKIFGNGARIKLMRFLVLNDRKSYSLSELEKRTGLSQRELKKEGEHLKKAGIARAKSFFVEEKGKKKRTLFFGLNPEFKHLAAFKNLFAATNPLSEKMIVEKLNKTGKIKFVVLSGMLAGEPDGRLDILIVGDRLDKALMDRAMHSLEIALGRELRYAFFETPDFKYRISVYDRLVRDVLDYPHRKILNKLAL